MNSTKSANQDRLDKVRHSVAHIMAQAVRDRFSPEGAVLFAGGPPIKDGFYYDFLLPRPLSDDDLLWIEARMREIIRHKPRFIRRDISHEKAKSLFSDQRFKLELIEGIAQGKVDDNGEISALCHDGLSIYQHEDFVDLCRGPHVESAAEIDPSGFKLHRVAGAYWRGDERNEMLQRIYGLCFESEKQLKIHLKRLEEAKKRDHRKVGKELELFFFSEEAPGMPYWLPNGLIVLNNLVAFWRREHQSRGYQEISAPLVHHQSVWEKSGHWEHYREDMFLMPDPKDDQRCLGLKPMNCPDAMIVFNHRKRSYKELPLRLSDCDVIHRYERSGSLHGLMRVRKFAQDDAHLFVAEDMIKAEVERVLEIVHRFYSIFGLKYSFRLGLRPDKYLGDSNLWDRAESELEEVLRAHKQAEGYSVEPGEGAFYGPKIDILMKDSLEREWQMGSIQLDFQLPRRFGCKFVGRDGKDHVPVVIHRVIYGSLERFLGILIEDRAGMLPFWLAPLQVAIVPISDVFNEYCQNLNQDLLAAGIRSSIVPADENVKQRIRSVRQRRMPVCVVIGEREERGQSVAIRIKGKRFDASIGRGAFISALKQVSESYSDVSDACFPIEPSG